MQTRLRTACAWLLALGALLSPVLPSMPAAAQEPKPPPEAVVQPALEGVFDAFKTHPIVGLGDDHGVAQGMDFYAAVIRDSRFAREVGNVVVEFGAGGDQAIADRYVNGGTVPYTELRKVWTDTIGWTPTAGYLGFAKLLLAVRQVNKSLPAARRIHVWLGGPPIDWPTVTQRDVLAAYNSRDSYPAEIIDREILAKGRKALVIYGGFHFGGGAWLRGRVEAKYPGAVYAILGGLGVEQNRPGVCDPVRDPLAKVWPAPAMVSTVPGKPADPAVLNCLTLKPQTAGAGAFVLGPGAPPGQAPAAPASAQPPLLAVGEAVLFVGPRQALTQGPFLPDYVMDPDYRREMARRASIGGGALVRMPPNYRFTKADYAVDLEAPGFKEAIDAMFAAYDKNGDGVVTAAEYVDPIP